MDDSFFGRVLSFKNEAFGKTELDEAFKIEDGFVDLTVLKGDTGSVGIGKIGVSKLAIIESRFFEINIC